MWSTRGRGVGLVYIEGKRMVTSWRAVLKMIRMGRNKDFEEEESRIFDAGVGRKNCQPSLEC